MASNNDYTTVALHPEDKERLDRVGKEWIADDEDDTFSYREVVNFLVDNLEEKESEYERLLAQAIINADEDDVERVITRLDNDKEFVKEVSNDESRN